MQKYTWTEQVYNDSMDSSATQRALKHSQGAKKRDYVRLVAILEQLASIEESLCEFVRRATRSDLIERGESLIERLNDLIRDQFNFLYKGGSLDVMLNLRLAHEVKLGISSLFWE